MILSLASRLRLDETSHLWLTIAVMKKSESLLDYVLIQLEDSKGQWREIADASGVPYDTLTKVAQRRNENPRVNTVQQLADYFRAQRPKRVAGAR